MSTKIYHAYRYTGSLHQLTQFLADLRATLKNNYVAFVAKAWAPTDFDYITFTEDLGKLLQGGRKVGEIAGVPMINPACSAVVYPVRIGRQNTLLVQFFGFSGGELGKSLPASWFKDFHYQNSSDTDVPEREWSRRKRVWDKVFKSSDIPAEVGLSVDLIGERAMYDLGVRVYEKLHGHYFGQNTSCEICAHRQAVFAAKREAQQ